MGLASALSTALTGLTAAESTIDVVGNNLANSNTVGFKASSVNFATQFLQTRSLGSAPTTGSGGNNPRQIGLGTMVADITPDFNQGTIEISSNQMDLAIQGEGFFIVQGSAVGEQLYSRNGVFKLNANNEMVSITGNRLLGFGIDSQFVLGSSLVPLTIPLGTARVAEATRNVNLEGMLTPTGDLADTAEIIQTSVLGDAAWTSPTWDAPAPGAGSRLEASTAPVAPTTGAAIAGGTLADGTYTYRVVFATGASPPLPDFSNTEGTPSVATAGITIAGPGNQTISFTDIPIDTAGGSEYTERHIYRSFTPPAGVATAYEFVSTIADNVTTNFTDAGLATGAALNTDTISGAYSYFVTFADAVYPNGNESRPTSPQTPATIAAGRIQLRNLPVDAAVPPTWTTRRIYRNTVADPNAYYFVGEITDNAATTFTDNAQDSLISESNLIINPNYKVLNQDGPKITDGTFLTNVLLRDGTTYNQAFQAGELSFSGRKGGRQLTAKTLDITTSTTVQDLSSFMEEALGIRDTTDDPSLPDGDPNAVLNPGGSVTVDGRIRLVSNNGVDNRIDIGLSGLQLTPTGGTSDNVQLPFISIQTAQGQSTATDAVVYDSLGAPISVRLTTVLESRTSSSQSYRWFADASDNQPAIGVQIGVGTGLITFDGEGKFVSTTEATVSIERRDIPSATPLEFELDFSGITGLVGDESTLFVSNQDGSSAGQLTSFIVGGTGLIRGVFSNGATRNLGQIRLARFTNPAGLEQKGENNYAAGVNAGLPIEGNPGEIGIGDIIGGAVELSNTDIGANLIDLILASTMYRGNTRVITTAQQLFDELLALRR